MFPQEVQSPLPGGGGGFGIEGLRAVIFEFFLIRL